MRFGIISTAAIATEDVIPGINRSDHTVQAISSRDEKRAQEAADDLGIPDAYGSYEAMFEAEKIDAVYNPLPNSMHAEWSKRAADHGLDVLCEKPLTSDAAEARDLVEYCEERDVVLMEAFMYRYHPRNQRIRELARDQLGRVTWVGGTLKFPLTDPEDIRIDPALAGGSLMDLGCYPVSGARWILGEPDRVFAYALDTRDCGVDTQMSGVLRYDSGAIAQFDCSFDTEDVQRYRIEGENGWIEAEQEVTYNAPPDSSTTLEYQIDGRHGVEEFQPVDQYCLEVEHFAECVEEGKTPRTGGQDSINNMRVIDALYESVETGEEVRL
ncbi:gfo/Idh/MocA family oxidoreductase [Halorubrum sp. CBA1125]|uniref:Gfo/Idh/MocA family protein n=1 Tax=Halorubrum sp. CBA1125 TaxID=2668072 RepID=UPI0012E732BF|nr:Gfo/Idh/MocA family oxidoreductase [Halorubrum sp. CBA1125]MUW13376.1 gfo/Idh/MocA family oxidoreductase [Halorubrum sp. CBA1125]